MTVSARMRYKIFTRDNFTCQYCGQNVADDATIKLEIEHVMPRSKGGTDAFNNLVTSCFKCNRGKHADTPILFTTNHIRSKEEIKPIKKYESKENNFKFSKYPKAKDFLDAHPNMNLDEAIKYLGNQLKIKNPEVIA